jgi:uncharacterized BrkB/YihY/UPF0761 family membrane protein
VADTHAAAEGETDQPGRLDALKAKYEEYKTKTLERLEAERERRVSVRVAYDFVRRDQAFAGSLLAGGVSVKLFLWFLPFALSVVAIIGTLSESLDRPAEDLARDSGLAAVLGSLVADAVEVSTRARWYLIIFGIVLLLWAGLGVVRALALTSRLAWRMSEKPPIRKLYGSLGVVGIVVGILFVQWARNRLTGGAWYVDLFVLAVGIVVLAGMFVLMFTWLPRPDGVPWTAMMPGALLMTVGLLVIRLVTLVYFSRRLASADDLYGGLGLSVVFLAWLYIISRLLVASIALNATIWQRDHVAGPTPEATPEPTV